MRTLTALLLGSLTLTGVTACGADDTASDDGHTQRRIVPFLKVASHSNLDLIDGDTLRLFADYTLEATPDAADRRASLSWRGGSREDVAGVRLDLTATQDLARAPLGQRYLATDDFDHIELTLTRDGARAAGVIHRIELRLDVLLHIHHATLEARFAPTDPDGEPIDLRVELTGYIDGVGCTTARDTYDEAMLDIRFPNDDPDDPPECIEIFDRIRATPTDPDFPPAPYDLYADDTPEGSGGSTPVLSFD